LPNAPNLPVISGDEAVRALQRLGFAVNRQKGNHIILRKGPLGCVVPNHREIKTGTLSGLLKQGGVSVDEFLNALN
jgi:predicted RNA binding protein YcfA (HicA-like mRNA interferase family)